ncbi:hypothetical protein D3C76_1306240 [compost metagenome]
MLYRNFYAADLKNKLFLTQIQMLHFIGITKEINLLDTILFHFQTDKGRERLGGAAQHKTQLPVYLDQTHTACCIFLRQESLNKGEHALARCNRMNGRHDFASAIGIEHNIIGEHRK